jgi:hypothetical protein
MNWNDMKLRWFKSNEMIWDKKLFLKKQYFIRQRSQSNWKATSLNWFFFNRSMIAWIWLGNMEISMMNWIYLKFQWLKWETNLILFYFIVSHFISVKKIFIEISLQNLWISCNFISRLVIGFEP